MEASIGKVLVEERVKDGRLVSILLSAQPQGAEFIYRGFSGGRLPALRRTQQDCDCYPLSQRGGLSLQSLSFCLHR